MEMARFEAIQSDQNAASVEQQLEQALHKLGQMKSKNERYLHEIGTLQNRLSSEERRNATILAYGSNVMKAANDLKDNINDILPKLDVELNDDVGAQQTPTKSGPFDYNLTPKNLMQMKQKHNVANKLIEKGEFFVDFD